MADHYAMQKLWKHMRNKKTTSMTNKDDTSKGESIEEVKEDGTSIDNKKIQQDSLQTSQEVVIQYIVCNVDRMMR